MDHSRLGQGPRAQTLYRREAERFYALHPESRRLHARALPSMPDGVPSNVCVVDPFPVVVERGQGARLWDVDGQAYVDYHNGFGTSVYGHAHPQIVAALASQSARGTHFGALTTASVRWAELICERYRLDWVRFSSSGTEAVTDAVRLARAWSGRPVVARVEGCYHGTSDLGLISNSWEHYGARLRPGALPRPRHSSQGLAPRALAGVAVVPFNDLDRAERVLARPDVGVLLLEPVLFNVGAVFPEAGYLEGLRELCDRHEVMLVFDEVKTGTTVAWGGAEELFGVRPDLKVLGKGIGGGLAAGAVGACRSDLRQLVEAQDVPLGGTFSGNPLTAAAGVAALEALTPAAYQGLQAHLERLRGGLEQVIGEQGLPAYVIGAGAKGCLVWAGREPLRDVRDYCRRFDGELADTLWLYLVNRGLFLAPGQDEQWTHSIAHTDADADLFVELVDQFAGELRA